MYSRGLVDLALELHVRPQVLYKQMFRLRQLEEPQLERLWNKYADNSRKLARGVALLRAMKGFGQADAFYEGVEVTESWEKDFRPLAEDSQLTPVMLVMILDLYFQLVPATMVVGTPEVEELAKMLHVDSAKVVEVMELYQLCDPYLNRMEVVLNPLLGPCQQIWQRFGNDNPEKLAAQAAQLKDYYK